MKKLALVLVVLLTACSTTVPVKQKFPEAPAKLMIKCPNLEEADPKTTALSELLKVVVKNYSTYYQCAVVADGWQEWYQIQKIISEEANK
jgi:hypothetical protein